MRDLALPPRHLSMANSTDILQSHLEREHRHSLFMLERLASCRDLFSSFGVLTQNPGVLLDIPRYAEVLRHLDAELQVSLAFFRDEAAAAVEPCAPPPTARRRAVEALCALGVRVAIRGGSPVPSPRARLSRAAAGGDGSRGRGALQAGDSGGLECVSHIRGVGVREVGPLHHQHESRDLPGIYPRLRPVGAAVAEGAWGEHGGRTLRFLHHAPAQAPAVAVREGIFIPIGYEAKPRMNHNTR